MSLSNATAPNATNHGVHGHGSGLWTDEAGNIYPVPTGRRALSSGTNPLHARLRAFVHRRDGFRCHLCERVVSSPPPNYDGRRAVACDDGTLLCLTHAVSVGNTGTHHPSNLLLLCHVCNSLTSGQRRPPGSEVSHVLCEEEVRVPGDVMDGWEAEASEIASHQATLPKMVIDGPWFRSLESLSTLKILLVMARCGSENDVVWLSPEQLAALAGAGCTRHDAADAIRELERVGLVRAAGAGGGHQVMF